MDFVLELLIQLVLQVIGEIIGELLLDGLFKHAAQFLISRIGRVVVGGAVGVAFGVAWGVHLSGGSAWPKLLWASLSLAAAALVLAVGRAGARPDTSREGRGFRHAVSEAMQPPWRWSAYRLLAFAVLNLGISAGIAIGFDPAPVLR
jgi:hypothetical protein